MAKLKCPTCGTSFDAEDSDAMPFCSPRCKQIDLRRWLTEEIGMPVDAEDDDRAEGFPDNISDDDQLQ